MFLRFSVVSLFADFSFPEAFEFVTGVPAEDLPADVLIVHPLEERTAVTPRGTRALGRHYLKETLAGHRPSPAG